MDGIDRHEGRRDRTVPVHLSKIFHCSVFAAQLMASLPPRCMRDEVSDFQPGLKALLVHKVSVHFDAFT